ncbi:MAG: proton-conducting transporter membrane subunit [Desulfobacteraceae bacterium]|jgi:hydrogenase-4 component B
MQSFYIALILILVGGVGPLFLWPRFSVMKGVGVLAMVAGCVMGLKQAFSILMNADTLSVSFDYLNTFSLSFQIDPLSAFFLVAIFAVSLLAAVYSYHYMDNPAKALRCAANYLCFSLLVAAMALVVTANNMITFMLCWEIMSLSSFFLVVYNYEVPAHRKAGYLYFVFSQVGAMFIFAAFGIIYAHTGGFGFAAASDLPNGAKMVAFILAFIGFGSKAGIFPLHVWLPHAHPAAPSHISAVMSGVMIKTGIYGIVRMYDMLNWHTEVLGYIVLVAGVVSGILGVVYALGQHDIKRLLAYHSVENIGIILIGLGIGMVGVAGGKPIMAVLGFAGGLLHVLNHAIFKSLLFMGAGMVLHKTGTGSIDALGGLIKRMKITGTTFLIGSLAISGLPPFNGFVSEFLIYMGSFNGVALGRFDFAASVMGIVGLAIIGGLALACFTKVVGVVFQGEPRTGKARNVDEKSMFMLFPMLILAAACIVIGIYPNFFMIMAVKATASLQLGYGRLPLEPFMPLAANITRAAAIFFTTLMVIIALRMLLYRGKSVARSGTWGCGFTQPTVKMQYTGSSYAASILEFFKPVAPLEENHPPVVGRFPERTHYYSKVHDAAEVQLNRVIVNPMLWLFDRLRWLQHGDIHLYIGYILLAIVVLLFFVD